MPSFTLASAFISLVHADIHPLIVIEKLPVVFLDLHLHEGVHGIVMTLVQTKRVYASNDVRVASLCSAHLLLSRALLDNSV